MDINNIGGSTGYVVDSARPVQSVQSIERNDASINIGSSQTHDSGKKYTKEELDKAMEKFNTIAEDQQVYAEYEKYDKFDQIIVRLVDKETKEVVLEVPPKKILDMVAKMCEMIGVLVDKKA